MSNNSNLILPSNLCNWKNIINCIKKLLKTYETNIRTVSDIITGLREIKSTFDCSQNHLYNDDAFQGLGIFLESLQPSELRLFIDVSIRNILCYSQIAEELEKFRENELSIKNDVAKVSIFTAKTILACSFLCLMPNQKIDIRDGHLNVNLQQLYIGIIHGSKDHRELLVAILRCYLSDTLQSSMDVERQSLITLTIANCDPSPFTTRERLQTWPIILTSKCTLTDRPLPNSLTLWPMYFQRIPPSSLLTSPCLSAQLPIYINQPVLLPLLPLLTASIANNIGAINVQFDDFSCSIQKVHSFDPWHRTTQYSKQSIVENIAHCLLAIKTSQKDRQQCDNNFATDFTQSIIEDVILKLNSKTTPLQQARASLTSSVFRGSREGSISSNVARHSYSNSSSSRSGSLQLSSLSSRRSSSNTSSSVNKESDAGSGSGDKVDYSVHSVQPMIVEESCNHLEEEEVGSRSDIGVGDFRVSETRLDQFMSVSFSNNEEITPTQRPVCEGIRRLSDRCCEEDARYDNNRSRRQSLPCRLSQPMTNGDGGDLRIMAESRNTLAKLVAFVDGLLVGMFLDEGGRGAEQRALREDILKERELYENMYRDSFVNCEEPLSVSCEDYSLGSRDLATFDRVLNSSTFFDDEALHFFSKLSTMSSPDSVWTPHDDVCIGGDTHTLICRSSAIPNRACPAHDKPQSNTSTIVDYVNQLTNSIINDAMDHNFGPDHVPANRMSMLLPCDECLYSLAERVSVEIISTSLIQLHNDGKKAFDGAVMSPIYVRPFPPEYDKQLSVLIQMMASAISQSQTGNSHIIVFDQVTVEMEEILLLLTADKRTCTPEKVLAVVMAIIKDTGTLSVADLISHLMHNY